MGKVSFHKNCNKFLFSPALTERENYLNSNSQRIVKSFEISAHGNDSSGFWICFRQAWSF